LCIVLVSRWDGRGDGSVVVGEDKMSFSFCWGI
jgi:hypothetical protein